MRRFALLLLACLCIAPMGWAEEAAPVVDPMAAMFEAVDALAASGLSQDVAFSQVGDLMSAVVTQRGQVAPMMEGIATYGIVLDMNTGERLTWDDLFIDGDAAAEHMEQIAEDSLYRNAYSEYNEVRPMPRDNFAIVDGQLMVFYGAQQLSHFSGRAGGFAFYPYELEGLLAEGIPLAPGDLAQAKEAVDGVLAAGALPDAYAAFALETDMAAAAELLGLVDVPDIADEYAVYHFEVPQMRGVTLLSDSDDEGTAKIKGIMATRMDLAGLQTGKTTLDECYHALGEPQGSAGTDGATDYSRLPNGESLHYEQGDTMLEFHFVDRVLHSITLRYW